MSGRKVGDSVVYERCKQLGIDTVYCDNLALYNMRVNDSLELVKLDRSKYGLAGESISASLNRNYSAVLNRDSECAVLIAGVRIPVSQEMLAMLKALAIENINPVQEYSEIVAQVFMVLLKEVAQRKVECNFEVIDTDNLTVMQKVVLEGLSKYVKKIILGKGESAVRSDK